LKRVPVETNASILTGSSFAAGPEAFMGAGAEVWADAPDANKARRAGRAAPTWKSRDIFGDGWDGKSKFMIEGVWRGVPQDDGYLHRAASFCAAAIRG
jgi:hypothetical protein